MRHRARRGVALDGVIAPPVITPPRQVSRVDGAPRVTSKVVEYLVEWMRDDGGDGYDYAREKRFGSRKRAYDRVGVMTSDEPWRYWGSKQMRERTERDYACCSTGPEEIPTCTCGKGLTLRQDADQRRAAQPPLKWIRVSRRTVIRTEWEPVDQVVFPDAADEHVGGKILPNGHDYDCGCVDCTDNYVPF